MEGKVSDKDVLRLLSSLKNAQSDYPQDMIESRRDAFAKQAAAMLVLMNSSGGGTAATGAGQSAGTAATTTGSTAGSGGISMGTILETALVVAIVAEAGIASYVYREKISEFFQSTFEPRVEQVSSPPDHSLKNGSSIDDLDEIPAVLVTETSTPIPTLTSGPVPETNDDTQTGDTSGNSSEATQAASTPDPNDNNGLHLGQTKQPTKQPDNKKNKDKE